MDWLRNTDHDLAKLSNTETKSRDNTVISVVEPEPDFLAGARAGEKAPAPGCYCLA